jgi:hypothetical protein
MALGYDDARAYSSDRYNMILELWCQTRGVCIGCIQDLPGPDTSSRGRDLPSPTRQGPFGHVRDWSVSLQVCPFGDDGLEEMHHQFIGPYMSRGKGEAIQCSFDT